MGISLLEESLADGVALAADIQVSQGSITARQAWSQSYNINVTSTHMFTTAMAPLLLKSSAPRLIFVSSAVASMELQKADAWPINHSPEKGWPKKAMFQVPSYRSSKAGGNSK